MATQNKKPKDYGINTGNAKAIFYSVSFWFFGIATRYTAFFFLFFRFFVCSFKIGVHSQTVGRVSHLLQSGVRSKNAENNSWSMCGFKGQRKLA